MGSASDIISVTCGCGKRLKAPASAAGKRARCPVCGSIHTLPAPSLPSTTPQPAPTSLPPEDPFEAAASAGEQEDPFAAVAALASLENTVPAESSAVYCPQCRRPMATGAVLCVNCGYDSRTGKSVATMPAPPPPPMKAKPNAGHKARKQIDYMAPTGSLTVGIVFSAVAALAASVIWVVIAWATGYSIGYVAILIGIAAGAGMQWGQKGTSQTGGFIAGGMTVLAILTAKLVVLYAVMEKLGFHGSIWDLDGSRLGAYFFNPIGLVIIAVGVGAAYKTASGVIRD